jgi:hypothetical protein
MGSIRTRRVAAGVGVLVVLLGVSFAAGRLASGAGDSRADTVEIKAVSVPGDAPRVRVLPAAPRVPSLQTATVVPPPAGSVAPPPSSGGVPPPPPPPPPPSSNPVLPPDPVAR